MQSEISIDQLSGHLEISDLKSKYLNSLTRPEDGMWAAFRDGAIHYAIKVGDTAVGYGCVNDQKQLIHFYLAPEYSFKGPAIFGEFIQELQLKQGIVGTHNPTYLSIALHFVKDLKVHTYLFSPLLEARINEKEGTLTECQAEDLERIVDFCHESIGAPKVWLTRYIGGLIEKREIFMLEHVGQIIGTCEVRQSGNAADFADIGMIVSPDFRRQGYGTYLLDQAKTIAYERGKTPICSCEKDNVGSLRSIHNCGFGSNYQLLAINFKD